MRNISDLMLFVRSCLMTDTLSIEYFLLNSVWWYSISGYTVWSAAGCMLPEFMVFILLFLCMRDICYGVYVPFVNLV